MDSNRRWPGPTPPLIKPGARAEIEFALRWRDEVWRELDSARRGLVEVHHHAYQLRDRRCTHLLHDARPVNFHCALTDAEVGGHHLVGFAAADQLQDLALTRRERFVSLPDDSALAERRPVGPVLLQRT